MTEPAHRIYLDNAATTYPKPAEVFEMTFHFMKQGAGNPGRGGHSFALASSETVENTRRLVARFFGVTDYRRVIFTYNCTDSINMVLKGYLKRGDHVIASNLDHNSVSRPLETLANSGKIELTRVPFEDGKICNSWKNEVRKNTKLLVINHGSNVLGSVQDLEPFCEAGIPVLLDAAQTAGRIPISVGQRRIFVACSAHKSFFGMPGLGILIVPEDIDLAAWREGGSGTASENLAHPRDLPMHLEAGTPNFFGIAALFYGLSFIEKEGMKKIHQHEWTLADQLVSFLKSDARFVVYSNLEPDDLAVIALNVRNAPPEEVAAILDQRFGIAIRSGLHCAAVLHRQLGTLPDGCLRISPGYFNTSEEIDALIAALKEIATAYG